MPELPEVETVRRTLGPALGHSVASVWTSGKKLRQKAIPRARIQKGVVGSEIERVDRRGKYLLLYFEGRDPVLLVHLGMSGRLRLMSSSAEPRPHTHLVLGLEGGLDLRFSDPRRFGSVALIRRGRELEHAALNSLGPDPLTADLDPDHLYRRIHSSARSLKSILLDQAVIAGIGNIYACEALFEARIRPSLPGNRLSRARTARLAVAIRGVLERALAHGGTSLKDFVAADGAAGEHSHYLWVYGRVGEPCVHAGCPGLIRRRVQHGRATFYCARCQTS